MGFFWVSIFLIAFFYITFKITRKATRNFRHLTTFMTAAAAVFLTVSLVRFPKEAFEASISGLEIWWQIVFPALLPFFIFAQILIGLGAVHMMGVILEPVMRPVFNVPGSGSFVLAMGLASGFPIGAILTTEMRKKGLVSKVEAERLLSFTNTADPLFMFGAVAVGMFGYPEIGITIAMAHYLSSITVGLLMRFYGQDPNPTSEISTRQGSLVIRSFNALIEARRQDGRTLGQLMGDAIHKSIETQLLIGGFIILFSVIIRILDVVGMVSIISTNLSFFLNLCGLDPALAPSLVNGFFEIDLGCQVAGSSSTIAAMNQKIITASMIIAWSGLSVHAQVASIVSKTDINIKPYIFARLVHTILAGFYSALLIGPAEPVLYNISHSIPVFLSTVPAGTVNYWWYRTYYIFQQLSIFFLCITALSLFVHFSKRLKLIILRIRN